MFFFLNNNIVIDDGFFNDTCVCLCVE